MSNIITRVAGRTAFLLLALCANSAHSQTFDVALPSGKNYDQAQFRMWVPENAQTIKAALVLVPGSNGDGRDQVDTALWRDFATEQQLALVGVYMTDKLHDDMFIEHYVNVAQGSGDALLDALTQFAGRSDRPELGSAPLLFWGMSAGGEYNYEFALWRPERVAAFVVNKGGIYYSALASKEARQVPGLFFVGKEDLAFRNDIVRGIYSINRRAHARWALIEQAGVAHAVAGSDVITVEFFREVLQRRLKGKALQALDLDSGFFCDPDTNTCVASAGAESPGKPVAWLATEALTEVWKKAQSAVVEKE